MDPIQLEPHYSSRGALRADLVVHLVGLTIALVGGGILLGVAFQRHAPALVAAVSIYVTGFVAMLGLSIAYNFAALRWRPFLRRLDHAGIFLMIAGSYTPFTIEKLHGPWAIGMTVGVWLPWGSQENCSSRVWGADTGSCSIWR